jgi:S-formylglutathione hydrolase FrmB
MSIGKIEFLSPAMGQHVSYTVILPDAGEGPFPVLMQLHGLTDSHAGWVQYSNIARHAAGYPMMIVFPDSGTGAYLDWIGHDRIGKRNYESLIVTDITNHLLRHFNVTDGPWAIGGLSMGGYGSMRLGLKYANRFKSIWSHSSKFEWEGITESRMFADPQDTDVRFHARNVAVMADKPVITFDCGTEDELLEESRRFHTFLDEIGLEHTYNEHPGGHEWDYWDKHVQPALAQHARVLGIERSGS